MPETIVVTPVKNSWETTIQTIEAISKASGAFEYYVFNDFSSEETKTNLELAAEKHKFHLIHLEDITTSPSPNYKLVLELSQKMAVEKACPLILVESDVIIKPETLSELIAISRENENAGLIGAITVDKNDDYNFPYNHVKTVNNETVSTTHSISFCCSLISLSLLQQFNFTELSDKKDWYDIFLSRKSLKLGFKNYLAKGTHVLHLPHSSRPWKLLKYKNPFLYYLKKYTQKRDRI